VSENATENRQSREGESRPTVGLLIPGIGKDYESAIWSGVAEGCQRQGANLICFVGGSLRFSSANGFESQRNAAYDLATADNVDGLVVTGSLASYVSPEEFKAFCERYHTLPIVSVGLTQEAIPGVVVDNYGGMRSVIAHLTQVHGYRRVAFIRGPEGNEDAEQRYLAYTDVLTEYGLRPDSALVVPGDYTRSSGIEAVRLLLDELQVDFDAVVAANDNMALGALGELRRRGIRVPYDMVVAGFGDVIESRTAVPSLTTVRQPAHELGQRAVEALFTLLAGGAVPERVIVPTRLVVRQSCGCLSQAAAQAAVGYVNKVDDPLDTVLASQREDVLFKMAHTVTGPSTAVIVGWAEQLLDGFQAELNGESEGAFLSAMDTVLREVMSEGGEVAAWQGVVSSLRQYVLPYLLETEDLIRAEDLWQQARVLIGEMAERSQALVRSEREQQAQAIREIGQALITAFDMRELMDVVVRDLPRVGIPRCYVSLYKEEGAPAETSELILAYDEYGHVGVEAEARVFASRQLVPSGLLTKDGSREPYSMVVEPLYLMEEQLGFVLFAVGPQDGYVYETLRGYLSSALRGALLVQEVDERTKSLQEANFAIQRRAIHLETSAEVAQAIISIFDVEELSRKAVNLIRDRFGFYHAGIFLLDESGKWAVLREATGEAGARMKAEGHRLAVGETSMVGWTAFHRQPRVALYAEEDAVRFANPHLPHTRSEMALPMLLGGRLLGVLNVQSTEEAAFDDDDVRALQSMANQVAIAIENARQISEEARLLEVSSPIYRLSRSLAQATTINEVASCIIASVAETGADGCTVVEFEFSPSGEPQALLYRGVWRQDREIRFQPGMRLPIEESPFPFEMISTLLTVTDVDQDENLPERARQVFIATGVRALANIPLGLRGAVAGQVVVLRTTPGPFSDVAMRLYEALSDQGAVALERAQLWEQAQQRAAQERLTRQVIDRIRRTMDIEQALQTTARELARAMNVPHVSVNLIEN
jgi:DNA-binding LacI/PurR family transcriptional regulator/GAF domain-containing protein